MKLLKLLFRHSIKAVAISVILSLLAGVSSALLVSQITRALAVQTTVAVLFLFVGLCLFRLACTSLAQYTFVALAEARILELRMTLSRQILATPLRLLEEIGTPRLLSALTEDIIALGAGAFGIASMFTSGAIALGCLGYLAWLSPIMCACVCGFLAIAAASHWAFGRRASSYITKGRVEAGKLARYLRALVDGNKELKLHNDRRDDFLAKELATARGARAQMIRGQLLLTLGHSWVQFLYLVLLGFVVFAWRRLVPGTPEGVLSGCVVTLLVLQSALEVMLALIGQVLRASVALATMESLGLTLSSDAPVRSAPVAAPSPLESIELRGVSHAYRSEEDGRGFVLGPIDLTLRPGEIVFLVGGNGSGKSTLAKLLTGLYTPSAGEVLVNGRPVTDATREAYLQHFSTVFSDFFLFDEVFGVHGPNVEAEAKLYLQKLRLQHKVSFENGRFSTIDLSSGQRKRLALLAAYLEDRPVYVFDEWASDQDPSFKSIFYKALLPELKARGKTVVVISHDDRYFNIADSVFRLEAGKIELWSGTPAAAAGGPFWATRV
ncbi:MAG: cyclic peptide export ABC transporter [Polyangiales bacterium]